MLYAPVSSFIINKTNIDTQISNGLTKQLVQNGEINTSNNRLPDAFNQYIQDISSNAANIVIRDLTKICVKIISFVAVFILVKIILTILRKFLRIVTKLPIIKQLDKIGGTATGLLKGIVIVYAALAIISIFFANSTLTKYILKSELASIMYNKNIILLLLLKK